MFINRTSFHSCSTLVEMTLIDGMLMLDSALDDVSILHRPCKVEFVVQAFRHILPSTIHNIAQDTLRE